MDDARPFEAASFEAYIAGLREAGWSGDAAVLRFGYQATLSLLLSLFMGVAAAGVWFAGLMDPAAEQMTERIIGHPLAEVAAQWSAMQPYLLDIGDEALDALERGLV